MKRTETAASQAQAPQSSASGRCASNRDQIAADRRSPTFDPVDRERGAVWISA
jgi:hypothetical protein